MSVLFARAGLLVRIAFVMGMALPFAGTAQARPSVEHVKICDVYGAGSYYLPGSDSCIKLGGVIKATATDAGTGIVCNQQYFTPEGSCRSRSALTFDVRTCTEYGTLRAYVANGSSCLPPSTSPSYVGGLGTYRGYTWVGVEGGFGSSFGTLNTISQRTFGGLDPLSADRSADVTGVNGRFGVTGGADWIVPAGFKAPAFLGIEGSVDYNIGRYDNIRGIPGSQLFTPFGPGSDSISLQKTWEASLGPRGGFSFGVVNLYGTAGISVASFTANVNCGTGLCAQNFIPQFESSGSAVRVGGYAGIGFNTGQGLNTLGDGLWRWGGEIRYTDYGTLNITSGNPATYQGNFDVRAQEVSVMMRIMHRSNF